MTLVEQRKFKLRATTREEARSKVVRKFFKEKHGEGTGDLASKYEYVVETYSDYKVVLKRPARINKGFDFLICTPGIYYKTGKKRKQYPSDTKDIPFILTNVKQNIGDEAYKSIKTIINQIFMFKEFDKAISNIKNINLTDADGILRPLPILLLTLYWLFMEQDITYWNASGRKKLMDSLVKKGLA